MRRSRRYRNRNRILFTLLLIAALFFTDSAARVYLIVSVKPYPVPLYLASEFHQLGGRLTPKGYWVMAEFHGHFYNFGEDGSRLVVGVPDRYARTIYLFGNSGLQDPYSSDTETMASGLQNLYNNSGYSVRIVNRGSPGQRISGELAWLYDTPLKSGDIVVFMDGSESTPNCTLNSPLAVLELACSWSNLYLPRIYAAEDTDHYRRIASLAISYTRDKGIMFYHVGQPSVAPLTLTDGMERINVPAYGFVDGLHMNSLGDAIAARALFDALTLI